MSQRKKMRINIGTENIDDKSPVCNNKDCMEPSKRIAKITANGVAYSVALCIQCSNLLARRSKQRQQQIYDQSVKDAEVMDFDPALVARVAGTTPVEADRLRLISLAKGYDTCSTQQS